MMESKDTMLFSRSRYGLIDNETSDYSVLVQQHLSMTQCQCHCWSYEAAYLDKAPPGTHAISKHPQEQALDIKGPDDTRNMHLYFCSSLQGNVLVTEITTDPQHWHAVQQLV